MDDNRLKAMRSPAANMLAEGNESRAGCVIELCNEVFTLRAERDALESDYAISERLLAATIAERDALRALLTEVCPVGVQKVSADLDARIRSALRGEGE